MNYRHFLVAGQFYYCPFYLTLDQRLYVYSTSHIINEENDLFYFNPNNKNRASNASFGTLTIPIGILPYTSSNFKHIINSLTTMSDSYSCGSFYNHLNHRQLSHRFCCCFLPTRTNRRPNAESVNSSLAYTDDQRFRIQCF